MLSVPSSAPCLSVPDGGVSAGGGSRLGIQNLVDVDSELLGLTRQYSHCKLPYSQTLSSQQPVLFQDCHQQFQGESTRLSNPPCTLRCNGVNRWESLCTDPQATALPPFPQIPTSNRIVVKDNHRPCIEVPLDQSAALPPPPVNALQQTVTDSSLPANYSGAYVGNCGADYFRQL